MKETELERFEREKKERIENYGKDEAFLNSRDSFLNLSISRKYSYNFSWLGIPVIQYPQDIVAMQEIIWEVKPDLIIETGIAHGGSLILYASLLEMLGADGEIVGVDIDIRPHNKTRIENHPMNKRITMIEGSSVDPGTIDQLKKLAANKKKVLVTLDSNHTHEHVLKELELYSPFVSKDSYLVAFDTVIEDLPEDSYPDRSWSIGNNPKTAVFEFLKKHDDFVIDTEIHNKLMVTVAPDGYLKRIK